MDKKYSFEDATTAEALFDAMQKCKRQTMWKRSVAWTVSHGYREMFRLERELRAGKYEPRKPKRFTLTYPKVRPCSSTHIRDRIVQRSLNDLVIYPQMTRSFIADNMACQKGKGTDFAMGRLNHFMHRAYINNGNSVDGIWVAQADIHGYYQSMYHSDAQACFARHLDTECVANAMRWMHRQYPYDVGFEPGSQMVQILGISMLDPIDHYIKERLHARNYLRYMDDLVIIANDKDYLEGCLEAIKEQLKPLHMEVNPKKTRIYPIQDGIPMLGFTFYLTDTGKVLRIVKPENIKHERKKLRRMAERVHRGLMAREKFYECYEAWKAHVRRGNSYKLLKRMDAFVQKLLEENKDADQKTDRDDPRQAPERKCARRRAAECREYRLYGDDDGYRS